MIFQITLLAPSLIAGLGAADYQLPKKARIIFICVSAAAIVTLFIVRLHLPTEVIK